MPLKIFYLDDEAVLLQIFENNFSDENTEVSTFTDPNLAVAESFEKKPDLFFIDFRMPDTNGIEVAKKIDPKIPMILVTGDLTIENTERFVAFFEKPMDYDLVSQFIDKFRVPKR